MQGGVQKPKHKVHKHHKSLTLERFAAAKASGYNKQEKKDKEFALNAKKVNQYHKLQRKLQQSGTEVRGQSACSDVVCLVSKDNGNTAIGCRQRPPAQICSCIGCKHAQAHQLSSQTAAPQTQTMRGTANVWPWLLMVPCKMLWCQPSSKMQYKGGCA